MEVIDAAGNARLIDEAAQIWAEATAARDQCAEVPPLEDARPVIEDVLAASAQAFLLIARSADGTPAGFAAIGPVPDSDEATAQVSYIGVRPGLWGQGVGGSLLRETRQRLKAAGYTSVELFVYVDNQRATALYERLGWQPAGMPTAHPRTGKPEQRYRLPL